MYAPNWVSTANSHQRCGSSIAKYERACALRQPPSRSLPALAKSRMNAVRPSYQSWLPGSAYSDGCGVSVGGTGIAAWYGPFVRSSYCWFDGVGYTSSPPITSARPRGSGGAPSTVSSGWASRYAIVYVGSNPSPRSATKSNQASDCAAPSSKMSSGSACCSSRLSRYAPNQLDSTTRRAVTASCPGESHGTGPRRVKPSSWGSRLCGRGSSGSTGLASTVTKPQSSRSVLRRARPSRDSRWAFANPLVPGREASRTLDRRCRLSSVGQSDALVMRRSTVRLRQAAPWGRPRSGARLPIMTGPFAYPDGRGNGLQSEYPPDGALHPAKLGRRQPPKPSAQSGLRDGM